jgi:hypothetical protein
MVRLIFQFATWMRCLVVAMIFALAYLFLLQLRLEIKLPSAVFVTGLFCMLLISLCGVGVGIYEFVLQRRVKLNALRSERFTVADPRFQ